MPVYNTDEAYLHRSLNSILNQTFQHFEIIIVNDGSQDSVVKILEEYAQKDSRIKVIHQTNQGLSAARNAGINIAKGDYISFIDSDDWIDLNYYETLYNLAVSHDADVVMSGLRFVNGVNITDNLTPNMTTNDFIQKVKRLPNGSVCDKLFKLDLFQKYNLTFPIGKFFEDNVVLIKMAYYSNKWVFTNEVSYYYFTNDTGICHSKTKEYKEKREKDRLAVASLLMNFAKEVNLSTKQANVVRFFILRSVVSKFKNNKEIQSILGLSFVFRLKLKKILECFYKKKNNKVKILGITVYKKRD